ncbi:hypothetical protein [Caminibacter pacificus]
MPIKFESNQINLNDYKLEVDFKRLGIDNVFINLTKYIQVENNQIIFLNEDKKVLGVTNFENEEKAVNFFNMITFLTRYKIVFKDKFAIKED